MGPELSESRERRLDEVVGAYLQALAAGQAPAREELLDCHPDLMDELAEFFSGQDQLERWARPLRPVAQAAHLAALPTQTRHLTVSETGVEMAPDGGTAFGDYELLGELGRGGMGVVYRARQKGLGRQVALKVVGPADGAGGPEQQRFRNEAEMVAQLDHPHIVPVYEVGAHAGQLYLSMKLLEGGSLAEHLGRFAADSRAAARLLAQTARAVHHAHQRGILHRDLKPANILLDGQGQPHVGDFGLARRVEGDSGLTQSGALVGTPSYMAPEQTTGQKGAVTVAADVYGLGAVLYALLTGRAPFRADTPLDTLLLVRERDPEPPRRSNPRVSRDLEAVCLKCLEKDPGRRYGSAEALAEDLERWLKGEPVQARALTRTARAWRWCRRNPLGAILLTTVALLVVVLAASTVLVGRLYEAADQARRDEARERKAAETQRDESDRQREQSDANLGLAFQTLDNIYMKAAEKRLRRGAQRGEGDKHFLQNALLFYEEIGRRNAKNPKVWAMVAQAHRRAGDIYRELGQQTKSKAAYGKAIALLEPLVAGSPGHEFFRDQLAIAYNNLGLVLRNDGDHEAEERAFRKALEVSKSLLHDFPNSPKLRRGLATVLINLGALLERTGPRAEAEDHLLQALALFEGLLRGDPTNAEYARELAECLGNLSILLGKAGRMEDAEEGYRRALRVLEQVTDQEQDCPSHRHARANLCMNLGSLLKNTGRSREAVESYQRGVDILKKLTADCPDVTSYRTTLAICWLNLGQARQGTKALKEAESAYLDGLVVAQALVAKFPQEQQPRWLKGQFHDRLGFLYGQQGRGREAVEQYRWVVEVQPDSPRACSCLAWLLVNVSDPQVRDPKAAIPLAKKATRLAPEELAGWVSLGAACYRAGKWDGARAAWEKALELPLPDQTEPLFYLAMSLWQLDRREEARQRYQQALKAMQQHRHNENPRRVEAAKLLGLEKPAAPDKKEGSPRQP